MSAGAEARGVAGQRSIARQIGVYVPSAHRFEPSRENWWQTDTPCCRQPPLVLPMTVVSRIMRPGAVVSSTKPRRA